MTVLAPARLLELPEERQQRVMELTRFYFDEVVPFHAARVREHRDAGLDLAEQFRLAAVEVVERFGERGVEAIRWVLDRRIRTRAAAVRALLRDVVDLKTGEPMKISAPRMPSSWRQPVAARGIA